MKKLKDILLIILLIIIGIPLFILAIPFIIVIIPIGHFQRKKFEKKYAEFLIKNNGKNFFCYNNRKNSKKYVEDEILPNLTNEIQIVYLNGKKIESEYNPEFISEALYKLKNYNRFPHLMKIRNGKLIDKSINNPFYNILNQNKPKKELLGQIDTFFELTTRNTNLMNVNYNLKTMKRLFKELWLQSDNCTEPIEHIWFSINEVAKSTNNSSDEIKRYLNLLIEKKIIEFVSSEPLLHKFTEYGKGIKTESDMEKTIKNVA